MLNKLKFNNLIITNKKKIQQGRVQVINKLVQKIRKLKSQLEKHPDNAKNKERLRKSSENLEYLKKLKCSDAVKRILLLEKSPSIVITNGLSTPEEIALALLAQNKIMQDLIILFKEQLDLTDSNLNWKEELLEPSKRRTKINRTEEKKKKRKQVKEQKANERKREDWIKLNNPYMEESVSKSATGAWKIEPVELEHSPASLNGPSLDSKNEKADNETNDNKMENDLIAERVKSQKELKLKKLPKFIDGNTKAKPKKINNEGISKMEKSVLNTKLKSEECHKKTYPEREVVQRKEPEPIVTHVVDPFFITESGENYLAIAVNVSGNQSNDTGTKDEINGRPLVSKKDDAYTGSKRPFENSKRDEFHGKRTENFAHKKLKNADETSLHPSWAAKQKLKPVITSFQGKKITFEDGDIDGVSSQYASVETFAKKTRIGHGLNNNIAQDRLHPSWVAKQKLKPAIAAFQGKKISFTNEYDED